MPVDLSRVHDASTRAQLADLFTRLEKAEAAVGAGKKLGAKKAPKPTPAPGAPSAPKEGGCCAVA